MQEEVPPPPPGQARLLAGAIPLERSLLLDDAVVNSFALRQKVLAPGVHRVRLAGARGCVAFTVTLRPDETLYAIWDFEMNGWRRHERVGGVGPWPVNPVVTPCDEAR